MTRTASQPGLPPMARRLLGSPLVKVLATPHGVDRYLELFNPLWSVNEVRAEVVDVSRETADAATLTLRPNANWRGALAGQYVRVTVEQDGVSRTRCYSISSSDCRRDGLLQITVKRQPGGKVSGTLVDHAHPGMIVTLSQAEGDFTVPEEWPTHLVFISAGSGITPCMAMLRSLLERHYYGHITFLHYARTYDDVIFGAELVRLADRHDNLKLRFSVTRETPDSDDFTGHYAAAHVDTLEPELAQAQIFVCGPQSLIDAVQSDIGARRLEGNLHVERFVAQTPAPVAEAASGEVRFARAERYVTSDGRSLLDQAEAAGLKPESGCRMGICMACKCTKAKGVTKNVLTGELSTEPDDEIQLCVSVPVGDVTLDI